MTDLSLKVHQPTALEEVLDLLSQHRGDAKVLAGGTDILPKMRAGVLKVGHLVSINRVAGLNRLEFREDEGLVIGGGVRITDVGEFSDVQKHYPGLAHACSVMATTQIRNMGTVAGNLANAAPSADTAPPLLVYKASLLIVKKGGRREVDIDKFFTGPGEVSMDPAEVIEAIRVPMPSPRSGSSYMRLSARSKVDIAAVGVAGFLSLDTSGRIESARLAQGAVAPVPQRCSEAEEMLAGQEPTEDLFGRAAAAGSAGCCPIDDVRASAAYRTAMVKVLTRRVLGECIERAKGGIQ
jgi:CO/xanthine dehydrogenase FAD-binding subunit